jgi:molybdopterin-containing oxidoreductase family iron-sulfur binding subunit
VLALTLRGRTVEAPAFVLPGHAEESVTLPLGYGRAGAESRARGVGFDAYALRTSAAPGFDLGLTVARTGRRRALATTQMHGSLEGRPAVREATLDAFRRDPTFGRDEAPRPLPLYDAWPARGVQWGMAVDLNRCTGCSACVVACQSENNVPVVGKADVERGRAMHWLRIDRYFAGPPAAPAVVFQPMLCQHCEKAPCEYVCPVNATTHSPDGLNEQTYNRCIGTRFCSNNCAWKVRRFNWFDYHLARSETEKMAMNPDVTVRERGVMEKCTFCVQRIREGEIGAKVEGRALRDGDVRTACQQACPSEAIVFGAVSDAGSRVAGAWRDPRSYIVLEELGTRPRIRYLARVRNPNPELA